MSIYTSKCWKWLYGLPLIIVGIVLFVLAIQTSSIGGHNIVNYWLVGKGLGGLFSFAVGLTLLYNER
jgi:hypothetical protein